MQHVVLEKAVKVRKTPYARKAYKRKSRKGLFVSVRAVPGIKRIRKFGKRFLSRTAQTAAELSKLTRRKLISAGKRILGKDVRVRDLSVKDSSAEEAYRLFSTKARKEVQEMVSNGVPPEVIVSYISRLMVDMKGRVRNVVPPETIEELSVMVRNYAHRRQKLLDVEEDKERQHKFNLRKQEQRKERAARRELESNRRIHRSQYYKKGERVFVTGSRGLSTYIGQVVRILPDGFIVVRNVEKPKEEEELDPKYLERRVTKSFGDAMEIFGRIRQMVNQ